MSDSSRNFIDYNICGGGAELQLVVNVTAAIGCSSVTHPSVDGCPSLTTVQNR